MKRRSRGWKQFLGARHDLIVVSLFVSGSRFGNHGERWDDDSDGRTGSPMLVFPSISRQRRPQPVAFPKNLTIATSAVVAITAIPALSPWLIRGRIRPEQRYPVARLLQLLYAPVLRVSLRHRLAASMVGGVLSAMLLTLAVIPALPPIWKSRGALPSTLEGRIVKVEVS